MTIKSKTSRRLASKKKFTSFDRCFYALLVFFLFFSHTHTSKHQTLWFQKDGRRRILLQYPPTGGLSNVFLLILGYTVGCANEIKTRRSNKDFVWIVDQLIGRQLISLLLERMLPMCVYVFGAVDIRSRSKKNLP